MRHLSGYEKETIINFNEAENTASIFTYNRTWIRHLESKLRLRPIMDNGCGGREYVVDKKRIRPPRPPIKLSEKAKAQRSKRLADARQKAHVSAKSHQI